MAHGMCIVLMIKQFPSIGSMRGQRSLCRYRFQIPIAKPIGGSAGFGLDSG
jgi:hypothetical protein